MPLQYRLSSISIVDKPGGYAWLQSRRGKLIRRVCMSTREGQQLGNYFLLRLLGSGGFADVYLGEHIHLKSQAAIKVLLTRLVEEHLQMFRTEAQMIARLKHPHNVPILDFDVKEGTAFIVMEYAPHGSLREYHPKESQLPLE